MLLIMENVMKVPRFALDPSIRYNDRVTAAMIVMQYLPQLTRWGKTSLVS